jgi:hypothetical protein
MRLRTRLIALTVVVAAGLGVASLAVPTAAQARIFYVGSSAFSPAWAEDPSGVSVTFINSTSAPRHVVSYSVYGTQDWSMDITLAPFEQYRVPRLFYCSYPSCSWSATYLFRVPEQSRVVVDWGYSDCYGFCGRLTVHG